MSTSRPVTRSASRTTSRAGSEAAEAVTGHGRPARRPRVTQATPTKIVDSDKPTISNKNSKAYGSSGKIAEPAHTDADEALRPAGARLADAVNAAQSSSNAPLPALDEEGEPSVNQGELQAQANPQPQAGTATGEQDQTTWAPHGVRRSFAQLFEGLAQAPRFVNWPRIIRFVTMPFEFIGHFLYWLWFKICWLGQNLADFIGHVSYWLWSNICLLGQNLAGEFGKRIAILTLVITLLVLSIKYPAKIDPRNLHISQLKDVFRSYTSSEPCSCACFNPSEYHLEKDSLNALSRQVNDVQKACNAHVDDMKSRCTTACSGSRDFEEHFINWFEPGQGARIDKRLTSPSLAIPSSSWFDFFKAKISLRHHAHIPMAGSAIEALQPWQDGGLDRWCAPKSRGKVQLVVQTAREIAPSQLIVEHVSQKRSILVGSAPREIEFWVEVKDYQIREEVFGYIARHHPDLLVTSSPQKDRELAKSNTLDHQFVLVGRWNFDIHSSKETQVFNMPINLKSLRVKSNKFAVRANSNWGGGDATCVNRVRLHGADVSGMREQLEA